MSDPIKTVRVYDAHQNHRTWSPAPRLHCPGCSSQSVWVDDAPAYRIGETFLCVSCGARWTMPTGPEPIEGDQELKQIRDAIASADGKEQGG